MATSSALVMCLVQLVRELCGAPPLELERAIETAYELERVEAQGGGMDQLSIGRGGSLLLQGSNDRVPTVLAELPWPEGWEFLVLDSGVRKHTPTHIAEVRRRLQAGDRRIRRYVEIADRCAIEVWAAVAERDLARVRAMLDVAHRAMRDHLRSSTPALERLREIADDCGCDGMKLSGAGGGGVLFTVVPAAEAEDLAAVLEAALRRARCPGRVLVAAAARRGMRPLRQDLRP